MNQENGNATPPSPALAAGAGLGSAKSMLPLVVELTPMPNSWHIVQRLSGLPKLIFFDSAQADSHLGRYSFVAADPYDWLSSHGRCTFTATGVRHAETADPFTMLANRLGELTENTVEGLPPFQGGAAGLFSYDLCHHLERLPRARYDEFQVPDLAVGLYDWVISFDHQQKRAWLVSTGFPETEPASRLRRAQRRLRQIRGWLDGSSGANATTQPANHPCKAPELIHEFAVPGLEGLLSNFNRDGYLNAGRRVIDYIGAGDCFQVNLAQRLLYPAPVSALELYARLRLRNPAPFAGYFDLGEFTIASASPERFLRVQQGCVETRPIKGTRPRGRNAAEDHALVEELANSPKDRAENVMIVDLLRNDLGRVCAYHSIDVPAVCRIETYPFIHHLVSEVRGRLRTDKGPIDLLRAAFPGGSVTGAPKIRAMEIIAEIEPTARGPYCGSLGYLGFDGSMDTNILIRTFTVGRGWVQFPVGGGIVADSTPEKEYLETWHKAESLLCALK